MSQLYAPAALYPLERPRTHCTGGWVGPRAGLDSCGKSRPHRDSIPGVSSPNQSLYRLRYPTHHEVRNTFSKNLGTRMLVRSKIHHDDPQTLAATL
jgi:hypothetical protein